MILIADSGATKTDWYAWRLSFKWPTYSNRRYKPFSSDRGEEVKQYSSASKPGCTTGLFAKMK